MKDRKEVRGARRIARAIGERLSYANVLATAAVFIALGGSAWAVAANSVGTKQLKNNAVKTPKIANGAVKTAKIGDGAVTAAKLAGEVEPWQPLPLNTFFQPSLCFWTAYGAGQTAPAYFRDSSGVVHLKGFVRANDGNQAACGAGADFQDGRIALLPVGYQPDEQWVFPTLSNDAPGRIDVNSDGQVRIGGFFPTYFPTFANATVWVSLDGITFRCAPSGSNGCP